MRVRVGLRRYVSDRGWQIYREFVDEGVLGCRDSRPEVTEDNAFDYTSARLASLVRPISLRTEHRPQYLGSC